MLNTRIRSVRFFTFISVFCCIGLFAVSAFAQVGSIKGKIRNQNGDGIANAEIEARQQGKVVKSTRSNNKGEFQLDGLQLGIYNIAFNADGYSTGVLHNVEVKNGTRDLGGKLILSVDQGSIIIVRGSVFYKEGTSLGGAKVDLELVNSDGTTKKLGSTYTTVGGEFTFRRPKADAKLRITAKFKGSNTTKEIIVDNAGIYRTALTLDISRSEK